MTSAHSLFRRIDSMDPAGIAELFAHNATMTFGNGEPMAGRSAIAAGSAAFFTSIAGLRHHINNQWIVEQDTIVETAVTYTRRDGTKVTIPAVSIWRDDTSGFITDYRVFIDLAAVFVA